MSLKTFAAISVGSFELTMKIFEFSGKNTIREIDYLSQNIDLGSETYATGTLSKEKIDELCRTLLDFKQVMKSYQVDGYRAYGTSALRETKNTLIVLDQIAQRTGIEVKILSNSEQRFLDYKSIASKGESFRKIIEEKTAIVDISNGSIQLSLFDNDALMSTQNLRLGVLRLQEMLTHLNARRDQLESLVDELAEAQLAPYKKLYLKDREIKNIIIVDDYISPWAIRRAGNDAGAVRRRDDRRVLHGDGLRHFSHHREGQADLRLRLRAYLHADPPVRFLSRGLLVRDSHHERALPARQPLDPAQALRRKIGTGRGRRRIVFE